MFHLIYAETLKYKRSFDRKLVFIAPSFFIVFALYIIMKLPSGMGMPWEKLSILIFNWWPLIFIPLGTALLCALSETRERKAGNYKNMLVHNNLPILLWFSKIIVVSFKTLSSILIVTILSLISALMSNLGINEVLKIIAAGVLIWMSSLSLIPLQLFISSWKGTLASIALGVIGMISGVIMAPESLWLLNPWSLALRVMCPVIGIHPNGITLSPGDSLLNPSVIPIGIIISFVLLIGISLITGLWFVKREVL